jgi:DNA-binding transcriptional MerR regulator/DNA-directed RNA polymerase subunit RPC12/RpoP
MSDYTTGELARQCGVSVRTVQFYDGKDLLKPSALTEGGRRLYSEDDLKKMRLICLLKSLGLSLDAIRGILDSEHPEKVLLLLLDEQERQIETELREKKRQKQSVHTVREAVAAGRIPTLESIADIEKTMEERKNLKRLHAIMLLLGIPATLIEWGTIILWILTGIWWPFAAGIPVAIALSALAVSLYYRHTAYICPECGFEFRPPFKEMFWARHTPKTRKLSCSSCGQKNWCVETYYKGDE